MITVVKDGRLAFDPIYSKQLLPVVDADGCYVKSPLPFGYTGVVTVSSSVFVLPEGMGGLGAWSLRCHFSVPAVEGSDPPVSSVVSTLVSLGDLKVEVSKGWCMVSRDGSVAGRLEFSMAPDRLYDLVFVCPSVSAAGSGDRVGDVHVYVNGYLLGVMRGISSIADKDVVLNAGGGLSVVYMCSVWSRVLSAAEVLMLYSLHRPAAGSEEDCMEGVREGLVCEFLPVNMDKDGVWWNTVAADLRHNIVGLDPGGRQFRDFIKSVGAWQAAGRMEGSDPSRPEWVKVDFYNYSFFGSQVCYVGLDGFSGVPDGITALNVPLVFTTRPISTMPGVVEKSTSLLVVDAAQGQTWQAPSGVSLAVLDGVLVPASGVSGAPIEDYVRIVGGSKMEQSYIDDVGRTHTVEFTLDDITNISYSFTYKVGDTVFGTYSSMMVATRADIEGPEQDVGTVVMSYYVNGVRGVTSAVVIRQEENVMTESDRATTLSLSTQSVGGNGGMVYYKAGYGVLQTWTSGFTRSVVEPCGVGVKEAWVSVSAATMGDWEGSLIVDSYLTKGTRVADVFTLAPEGYPVRSLTITQQGLSDIKVALQIRATDNLFANLTGPARSIWFTGELRWGDAAGVGMASTLIPFKEFHSGQEYSLGEITLPAMTKWEGIGGVLGCGVQTEGSEEGGRPTIGNSMFQCLMRVQLVGWNVNTAGSTSYRLKNAINLTSDPRVSYPAAATMVAPFEGLNVASGGYVSASGGVLVFEVSNLKVGPVVGFVVD